MPEVGAGETFLWETQSLSFENLMNSGWKTPESGSNGQTPTGKEVAETFEPLPPKGRKNSGGSKNEERSGDGGREEKAGGEADHEIHIWTEKERRKKMRNMYSNLHALLPQLPPKADKSTIINEAVSYIKSLQQELHKLQQIKLERLNRVAEIIYETSITTPPKMSIDTRENILGPDQINTSNAMSFSCFIPPTFQTWTSSNIVLNVCGNQAQYNVCAMKKPGLFTTVCYVMEKHNIDVLHASISSDNFGTMYPIQAQARIVPDLLTFPLEEKYKQAAAELMLCVSF